MTVPEGRPAERRDDVADRADPSASAVLGIEQADKRVLGIPSGGGIDGVECECEPAGRVVEVCLHVDEDWRAILTHGYHRLVVIEARRESRSSDWRSRSRSARSVFRSRFGSSVSVTVMCCDRRGGVGFVLEANLVRRSSYRMRCSWPHQNRRGRVFRLGRRRRRLLRRYLFDCFRSDHQERRSDRCSHCTHHLRSRRPAGGSPRWFWLRNHHRSPGSRLHRS